MPDEHDLQQSQPRRVADIPRREPTYEPRVSLHTPVFPSPDTIGELLSATDARKPPLRVPLKELVVLDYFTRGAQGLTDGAGALDLELATIPDNQWWMVDRILARGGAAGNLLAYAGALGNDLDLLGAVALSANTFAGQIDGNPVPVPPGTRIVARFVGAGNTVGATCKMFGRIVQFTYGHISGERV